MQLSEGRGLGENPELIGVEEETAERGKERERGEGGEPIARQVHILQLLQTGEETGGVVGEIERQLVSLGSN